ncbi:hypothetical protein F5Y16DRAFT_359185 [Xylariaceae sp. FL0255]|nr:hypothetical protein F5Y16DRAFT_359185 [Xylariaceae sp. FL0255]
MMSLPFTTLTSLPASFAITRPTGADVDTICEIYYESFKLDLGNTFWWPADKESMFEWMRTRIRRKMADRRVRHFQVIDTEKNVTVAFARWDIPGGYEAQFGEWVGPGPDGAVDVSGLVEQEEEKAGSEDDDALASTVTVAQVEEIKPEDVKKVQLPRGADPSLCLGFFNFLAEVSERWQAESMLGLSLLGTAPKYHRRGAAKALLEPMFAIADKAGLRSYLEATPTGRPIYEKMGFKTVETKDFDLDALTGGKINGIFTLFIMIREPQQP